MNIRSLIEQYRDRSKSPQRSQPAARDMSHVRCVNSTIQPPEHNLEYNMQCEVERAGDRRNREKLRGQLSLHDFLLQPFLLAIVNNSSKEAELSSF